MNLHRPSPPFSSCRNPLWAVLLVFLVASTSRAGMSGPAGVPPETKRVLRLRAGAVDPRGLPLRAMVPDDVHHPTIPMLVQGEGSPEGLRKLLSDRGLRVLSYVPDGGFIVRVPASEAALLAGLPGVRWAGEPRPGWKLSRDLGTRRYVDPSYREGGRSTLDIDLFPEGDPEAVSAEVERMGAVVIGRQQAGPRWRLRVRAERALAGRIAESPDVEWIEEAAEITLRNDTAHWVVQTDVPAVVSVWDHGLHGEGQVIGHIDDRLDMGSCYVRDAANNTPRPAHRKVVAYRSSTGQGADLHGTHAAGTAAGDQSPLGGGSAGNGHAWAAKLSFGNLDDISGSGTQASNLYQYLDLAYLDGARIHTNSWGDDNTKEYTTWCRDIDQYAWDHEDALVVFAVTNTQTLKSPENAKDCLAVGASDNGLNDDLFCSGGTGPTQDGRRKPEVFAPGCSIVSARAGVACGTTAQTGTSMAAPAVAGAAALVRQYYVEGFHPSGAKTPANAFVPSGALIKATVVNGAVDMSGIAGYPSLQEGWGRLLLENALSFAGDPRTLSVKDVRHASGLTTGKAGDLVVHVDSPAESLRVTLAWTDPPATLLAATASVNDLDLEVRDPNGTIYRGNVLSGGISIPGGEADALNNLEQVVLPSPAVGDWVFTAKGRSVPQGPQGYALVATADLSASSGPYLLVDGLVLTDTCRTQAGLSGDGAANPGEAIEMDVRLRNAGSQTATGVSGTLSTDASGVTVVDGVASYPNIAPGATALPVAADGYRVNLSESIACGASLPFTQSSTSGQGAWVDTLSMGAQQDPRVTLWSDSFETDRGWAVVAPNDATAGAWQRGDPQVTLAQPEDDHTAAPGALCWVTGLANGGADGANDLDGGTTTLRSPRVDLTTAQDPEVEYWRWYSNDKGGAPGEDTWVVQVSFDDGVNWIDLERTSQASASWVRRAFRLDSLGTPGASMRLRAMAADTVNPSLVEAALDDVRFTDPGGCSVCPDESTPPGEASAPGASPLRIAKAGGGGFDLSWSEPASGGRPSSYALYRTPFGSYAPACDGTLGSGTTAHRASLGQGGYLVVARNAGGEGSYGAGRTPAASPCP